MKSMIFDAESVRAIQAGNKTMTRQVIVRKVCGEIQCGPGGEWWDDGTGCAIKQPHQPGDIVYVKEPWQEADDQYGAPHIIYRADGASAHIGADSGPGRTLVNERILYAPKVQRDEIVMPERWRSATTMPAWAARLWLRIDVVRVERVQDINAKDIVAEGAVARAHHSEAFAMIGQNPRCPVGHDGVCYPDLRSLWAARWDAINAKRGHPWASNPWVWVYTFSQTERPEEPR